MFRKNFDRYINKFCNKYERFGIKNLMLIIVLGQAIVLLLGGMQTMFDQSQLTIMNLISFNPVLILKGQIWRLVTWVFMPESDLIWFIFYALIYTWFGRRLEAHMGRMKFTVYYVTGMLLTIIYGLFLPALYGLAWGTPTEWSFAAAFVTPKYISLTILLAFATLFPDEEIRIWFILPIKMKWLAVVSLVLMFWQVIMLPLALITGQKFSLLMILMVFLPGVALLNYLMYFGFSLMDAFKGRIKPKRNPNTIKFKQAAQEYENKKGYIYKCTVCNKTDKDSPDTEFRYCSRCGYKCYCSEHIFNHEHI